jgi:hypothetical protein
MKNLQLTFIALLFLSLVFLTGCGMKSPAGNYEAQCRTIIERFFTEPLDRSTFSFNSPWRDAFGAKNIAGRAKAKVAKTELIEVRLPSSPRGLEAVFRCNAEYGQPFFVGLKQYPAGAYEMAGSFRFVETTRGALISDGDFAVFDKGGGVIAKNSFPWTIAVR